MNIPTPKRCSAARSAVNLITEVAELHRCTSVLPAMSLSSNIGRVRASIKNSGIMVRTAFRTTMKEAAN